VITNGVVPAGTVLNTAGQFRVPPGPCTVLLANNGTAGTVFVGAGTAVTSLNGFPVTLGAVQPVMLPVPAGSPGQVFSACVAAGTASLAWMALTPYGQTGTGTLD
jgi:hypothetical protein